MSARPTRSPLGAPLLERLARRYTGALALTRTRPGAAQNRLAHVMREAEAAGITHAQIEAEAERLAGKAE